MKNIDDIAFYMVTCFDQDQRFGGITELILEYAEVAKRKCQTLRTDPDVFDEWANFVVAGEAITTFEPNLPTTPTPEQIYQAGDASRLLVNGVKLIAFVTRARTPMPKSSEMYRAECTRYCAHHTSEP